MIWKKHFRDIMEQLNKTVASIFYLKLKIISYSLGALAILGNP